MKLKTRVKLFPWTEEAQHRLKESFSPQNKSSLPDTIKFLTESIRTELVSLIEQEDFARAQNLHSVAKDYVLHLHLRGIIRSDQAEMKAPVMNLVACLGDLYIFLSQGDPQSLFLKCFNRELSLFTKNDNFAMMEILLHCDLLKKAYSDVCCPLLRHVLDVTHKEPLEPRKYMMYIVLLRLWKVFSSSKDEKKLVMSLASHSLFTDDLFYYLKSLYPSELLEIPENTSGPKLSKFFINTKFPPDFFKKVKKGLCDYDIVNIEERESHSNAEGESSGQNKLEPSIEVGNLEPFEESVVEENINDNTDLSTAFFISTNASMQPNDSCETSFPSVQDNGTKGRSVDGGKDKSVAKCVSETQGNQLKKKKKIKHAAAVSAIKDAGAEELEITCKRKANDEDNCKKKKKKCKNKINDFAAAVPEAVEQTAEEITSLDEDGVTPRGRKHVNKRKDSDRSVEDDVSPEVGDTNGHSEHAKSRKRSKGDLDNNSEAICSSAKSCDDLPPECVMMDDEQNISVLSASDESQKANCQTAISNVSTTSAGSETELPSAENVTSSLESTDYPQSHDPQNTLVAENTSEVEEQKAFVCTETLDEEVVVTDRSKSEKKRKSITKNNKDDAICVLEISDESGNSISDEKRHVKRKKKKLRSDISHVSSESTVGSDGVLETGHSREGEDKTILVCIEAGKQDIVAGKSSSKKKKKCVKQNAICSPRSTDIDVDADVIDLVPNADVIDVVPNADVIDVIPNADGLEEGTPVFKEIEETNEDSSVKSINRKHSAVFSPSAASANEEDASIPLIEVPDESGDEDRKSKKKKHKKNSSSAQVSLFDSRTTSFSDKLDNATVLDVEEVDIEGEILLCDEVEGQHSVRSSSRKQRRNLPKKSNSIVSNLHLSRLFDVKNNSIIDVTLEEDDDDDMNCHEAASVSGQNKVCDEGSVVKSKGKECSVSPVATLVEKADSFSLLYVSDESEDDATVAKAVTKNCRGKALSDTSIVDSETIACNDDEDIVPLTLAGDSDEDGDNSILVCGEVTKESSRNSPKMEKKRHSSKKFRSSVNTTTSSPIRGDDAVIDLAGNDDNDKEICENAGAFHEIGNTAIEKNNSKQKTEGRSTVSCSEYSDTSVFLHDVSDESCDDVDENMLKPRKNKHEKKGRNSEVSLVDDVSSAVLLTVEDDDEGEEHAVSMCDEVENEFCSDGVNNQKSKIPLHGKEEDGAIHSPSSVADSIGRSSFSSTAAYKGENDSPADWVSDDEQEVCLSLTAFNKINGNTKVKRKKGKRVCPEMSSEDKKAEVGVFVDICDEIEQDGVNNQKSKIPLHGKEEDGAIHSPSSVADSVGRRSFSSTAADKGENDSSADWVSDDEQEVCQSLTAFNKINGNTKVKRKEKRVCPEMSSENKKAEVAIFVDICDEIEQDGVNNQKSKIPLHGKEEDGAIHSPSSVADSVGRSSFSSTAAYKGENDSSADWVSDDEQEVCRSLTTFNKINGNTKVKRKKGKRIGPKFSQMTFEDKKAEAAFIVDVCDEIKQDGDIDRSVSSLTCDEMEKNSSVDENSCKVTGRNSGALCSPVVERSKTTVAEDESDCEGDRVKTHKKLSSAMTDDEDEYFYVDLPNLSEDEDIVRSAKGKMEKQPLNVQCASDINSDSSVIPFPMGHDVEDKEKRILPCGETQRNDNEKRPRRKNQKVIAETSVTSLSTTFCNSEVDNVINPVADDDGANDKDSVSLSSESVKLKDKEGIVKLSAATSCSEKDSDSVLPAVSDKNSPSSSPVKCGMQNLLSEINLVHSEVTYSNKETLTTLSVAGNDDENETGGNSLELKTEKHAGENSNSSHRAKFSPATTDSDEEENFQNQDSSKVIATVFENKDSKVHSNSDINPEITLAPSTTSVCSKKNSHSIAVEGLEPERVNTEDYCVKEVGACINIESCNSKDSKRKSSICSNSNLDILSSGNNTENNEISDSGEKVSNEVKSPDIGSCHANLGEENLTDQVSRGNKTIPENDGESVSIPANSDIMMPEQIMEKQSFKGTTQESVIRRSSCEDKTNMPSARQVGENGAEENDLSNGENVPLAREGNGLVSSDDKLNSSPEKIESIGHSSVDSSSCNNGAKDDHDNENIKARSSPIPSALETHGERAEVNKNNSGHSSTKSVDPSEDNAGSVNQTTQVKPNTKLKSKSNLVGNKTVSKSSDSSRLAVLRKRKGVSSLEGIKNGSQTSDSEFHSPDSSDCETSDARSEPSSMRLRQRLMGKGESSPSTSASPRKAVQKKPQSNSTSSVRLRQLKLGTPNVVLESVTEKCLPQRASTQKKKKATTQSLEVDKVLQIKVEKLKLLTHSNVKQSKIPKMDRRNPDLPTTSGKARSNVQEGASTSSKGLFPAKKISPYTRKGYNLRVRRKAAEEKDFVPW